MPEPDSYLNESRDCVVFEFNTGESLLVFDASADEAVNKEHQAKFHAETLRRKQNGKSVLGSARICMHPGAPDSIRNHHIPMKGAKA